MSTDMNNNSQEEDSFKERASEKTVPPELLSHPSYQELLQKLNESEQKTNQHWERILRMQADADNVSKRAERDLSNAHKYALEKFVNELIPIIDSLELCINNTPADLRDTASAVIEGVELTLKMFYAALEKFGIRQVNPMGEIFNPEFQQAIAMEANADCKAGTVLTVLQKGYVLNNRLVRPALVVVAKNE